MSWLILSLFTDLYENDIFPEDVPIMILTLWFSLQYKKLRMRNCVTLELCTKTSLTSWYWCLGCEFDYWNIWLLRNVCDCKMTILKETTLTIINYSKFQVYTQILSIATIARAIWYFSKDLNISHLLFATQQD